MPGTTQRGQVKGGVLQEWRVGSINLKEDRVLLKTLGMIDVQKKAFATLMKVDKLIICYSNEIFVVFSRYDFSSLQSFRFCIAHPCLTGRDTSIEIMAGCGSISGFVLGPRTPRNPV